MVVDSKESFIQIRKKTAVSQQNLHFLKNVFRFVKTESIGVVKRSIPKNTPIDKINNILLCYMKDSYTICAFCDAFNVTLINVMRGL